MAVTLPLRLVKLTLDLLVQRKRRLFIEACKDPELAQTLLKEKILATSKLPFPDFPTDYNFYKDKKKLTFEEVMFFETTSGSTGAKKKIPYTKSLLKSFENMFLLWVHDLLLHSSLGFEKAKFFMSVSPKIGEGNTDDRKYLSPLTNLLLSPFLVSNPDSHHSKTGSEFMTKVSEDIRRHRDLEIISIWSPTYLLSLLDYLGDTRLPQLKLISCWTHAQAEKSAEQLRRKFPDTVIQPKGLLLTEAPVTVPWTEAQGCVPLLTETLIEFLDQDRIIPLHKAEIGKEYVVLTSQYNGYLRYNTHDVVRVTGMYHKTPVLEFCGRAGITCDLAGEKLAENVLREVFNDIDGPFLIVPDLTGPLPRYVILHEDLEEYPWDEKLRSIYHYDLARKLNQLQAPVVRKEVNLRRRYLDFFQNEGMNLGDIKERILIHETNLAGRLLAWTEIANPSFQVDLEV